MCDGTPSFEFGANLNAIVTTEVPMNECRPVPLRTSSPARAQAGLMDQGHRACAQNSPRNQWLGGGAAGAMPGPTGARTTGGGTGS